MMHNQSFTLEPHETEQLLDRLKEWRLGICSNGTLASDACFVLDQMPSVVIVPDTTNPLTTYIDTGSKWTCNLVNIGVIYNSNDDSLLQTLADSYMIFKSLFQNRAGSFNVAHAIRLQKYATINIDNILRPTNGMQRSMEGVLSEPNEEIRWSRLMGFWDTYGYFWPSKIILGFRDHCSKPYEFNDQTENANIYHSTHLVLKKQMNGIQSRKDPYDLHDFINNSMIVARHDLTPLHELLHANYRDKIQELIQQRFTQIPVACHLKFYNPANDSYLSWSPRHSQDKYGDNFVIRPLSKDSLSTRSDKQFLWRLAWNTTTINSYKPSFQESCTEYRSSIVRGGSFIYIHPSCKTKLRNRNSIDLSNMDGTVQTDTHKMILACQPSEMDSVAIDDPKSNIRPLRLKTQDQLVNKNETKWLIEYPETELKFSVDLDSQIKLDIDQHIHKLKPLVQGDIIQLKQIGLLTAFDTDRSKMTEESYIQSLRRVRRMPQLDKSKSKSRKACMCVDEEDAPNGYHNNAYWIIELATADDLTRHYNGLKDLETQDSQITFESSTDQESEMYFSEDSATTFSINKEDLDDRARLFENLARTSTSHLLYDFVKKVTLDPLAHIVLPSRTKTQNNTDKK